MSRYAYGVILGSAALAAGCAIGMMFAPASGAEIRRRLAWRIADERKAAVRRLERLKARVEEFREERTAAPHAVA